jgi:hypothetical protein
MSKDLCLGKEDPTHPILIIPKTVHPLLHGTNQQGDAPPQQIPLTGNSLQEALWRRGYQTKENTLQGELLGGQSSTRST